MGNSIPFGTFIEKSERLGIQIDRYLSEHGAPLAIDEEGERQLKILLGILAGEIDASSEERKIVSTLVSKLVPGASPRSTAIKREDPGEYIARAMEANGASFKVLVNKAHEWAQEAEVKTRAVMEAFGQ